MERALALASRGAGHVEPNPPVGAVLVSPSGEVLGEGWHGAFGGEHAEVWAIRDAKRRGNGGHLSRATLVVTLEPCCHHGKTPPCADLIIDEGIPRVVIAVQDPNPSVAGRGVERLRAAGVDVTAGVCADHAARLIEAFAHHVVTGLPLLTLKIAQTLDGRVASRTGESRWVTGPESRALVHRLRAEAGAVMVGTDTALLDDPQLTVRHDWPGKSQRVPRQPLRVVLDRQGRLPASLGLFTDEYAAASVAVNATDARPAYAEALRKRGGHVLIMPTEGGHLSLRAVLAALGRGLPGCLPVQSVLVEAGPRLATALFRADLVDRLLLFTGPKLLGEGRSWLGDLGEAGMADAISFADYSWAQVGKDSLFRGYLRKV